MKSNPNVPRIRGVFPPFTLMSLPTAPSANFQAIFDAALDNYARQTGVNIAEHPSVDKLQNCRSPEDIVRLLTEKETVLKGHREKYRNLINHIRPVIRTVHAFSSVLDTAAEIVSLALRCCNRLEYVYTFQGAIPADKGDVCRHRCSSLRMYHHSFEHHS